MRGGPALSLVAALLFVVCASVGLACPHSRGSRDPAGADASDLVRIAVRDGTFRPSTVRVPSGAPLKLVFRLEGEPGCGDQVVFPELGVRPLKLRQGRDAELALPALPEGSHRFSCPMGMVRGELVVR